MGKREVWVAPHGPPESPAEIVARIAPGLYSRQASAIPAGDAEQRGEGLEDTVWEITVEYCAV